MLQKSVCPLSFRFMAIMLAVALLISSAVEAWAAPGARVLWQQAYPGLDSPDPDVRAETVQAIRSAKDVTAVLALIDHLEDPDQRVGLYIAQALVELAPGRTLPLLHAALWQLNADGRWRAAFVLGERQDTSSALALAGLLHDEEILVIRTAAEALAKLDTRLSASILVRHLEGPRPAEVAAAMNALLLLGDNAVPALAEVLRSTDIRLSMNAFLVLETIGTPEAMAALSSTKP